MSRHDGDLDELARFDRFLTDAVAGRAVAAPVPGLDPTMVAAVQRVLAADVFHGPSPEFSERLSQALLRSASEPTDRPLIRLAIEPEIAGPPINARPMPHGSPNRSLAPGRVWGGLLGSRVVSALATAALLLLTVAAALYVVLPTANESADEGEQERVYVASADGQSFREIDPETLADLPVAPIPATAENIEGMWSASWIESTDGSTLVRVVIEPDTSGRYGRSHFSVFDARTGSLRSRFEVPEWGQISPLLSADGKTLVVELPSRIAHQSNGRLVIGRAASWQVFDTGAGNLVTTIQADDPAVAGLTRTGIIDPAGTRLYRISARGEQDSVGPWPSQIVVHDLRTGQETGRIMLDEVRSGFWWTGASDPNEPVGPGYLDSYLVPSMVFTPDGTTLMVLEGDTAAVTVIDIATGASRRVELEPTVLHRTLVPASERETRFLPYGTHLSSIGSDVRALFAPDADHLLLGGLRRERDTAGTDGVWVDDLGLQLVELDGTASVLATAPYSVAAFGGVGAVIPSRDGKAFYVTAFRSDELAAGTWNQLVFARVEGATLAVEADRNQTDDAAGLVVLADALPDSGLGAPPGGTPAASPSA